MKPTLCLSQPLILPDGLALVHSVETLEEAFRIRRAVFIQEQQVSEDEEIDGLDGLCHHLLYRPEVKEKTEETKRLRIIDRQLSNK